MSDSPQTPPKAEPEAGAQSPDGDEAQMNDAQDPQVASVYEGDVKEQDRWLPIANVARIMKLALPDNAKIAKESKECMQECVSEFISFITSEASDKCHQEKRKTVNGEDILFAMTSLGFENYSEALKIYLTKYREQSTTNRTDNQHQHNRTGSQGFASGAPGASNTGASSFQVPPGGPGGEGAAYSLYQPPGHNGAGGEGY